MSEDCLFCGIVAGEIPSRTVYEDETTVAFLDVNPLARGHTLVVPKDHHETVQEMPAELAGDVFQTVRRVGPAVEAAGDGEATSIAVNNGPASGQEIPHVHVHVVPRQPNTGGSPLHRQLTPRPEVSDEEMDDIAGAIADGL